MSIDNGGPAFPAGLVDPATPEDAVHPMHSGMALRDYFAAKAMQGFMANKANPLHYMPEQDAQWAYSIADAMLKARGESK